MGAIGLSSSDAHERGDLLGRGAAEDADEEEGPFVPRSALLVWWTEHAKLLLLVAVVSQNSSYSLLRRYAGAIRHSQASTPSILALQEVFKLAASSYVLATDPATVRAADEHPRGRAAFVFQHSAKMLLPAVIYLVMNILGFVALARISAGLFAVLQQCKLIFTAALSWLLLGRKLSWSKWRSLLLLLAGVVLITLETTASPSPTAQAIVANATSETSEEIAGASGEPARADDAAGAQKRSAMIGVSAVLLEASLSGFANVYFEQVVKSTPLSIWHRNVQLSVWSLCIFVPMAARGGNALAGWDALALANALMGALGGILVALCIAYFDSIAKSVAVTMSVVLTVILGWLLLGGPMSADIVLGSLVVIVSTVNYSFG
ncbi:hypothetical protein KFE25_013590 [Diacronema lutheri]|uniref:UDP-galactose transporter n=1 Tax=Diacronema lutheri TaxID=2081491 RepID=A0A8J5XU26_DIALT|nr:hypothetical protein KFE25_013590 [Diacronema lutheri]